MIQDKHTPRSSRLMQTRQRLADHPALPITPAADPEELA